MPAGTPFNSAVAMTQNTLFYAPFSPGLAGRFDRVGWDVSTAIASTVLRVGVYRDEGGIPGALIAEADATVSTAATGYAEAVFTTPISVDAGELIWVAAVSQSGAGGVSVDGHSNVVKQFVGRTTGDLTNTYGGYTQTGVTGALPNPAVIATDGVPTPPGFVLRGA